MSAPRTVYVDPNFRPEYFYPLLKLLCVLYDRVIVWSPVQGHLMTSDFSDTDFARACSPSDSHGPIIIPAGRNTWFQRERRLTHPDLASRSFDRPFESRIRSCAEAAQAIRPSSDYHTGYRLLARAQRENPKVDEHIDTVANDLKKDLPAEWLARLDAVAAENRKSLSWAIANSYIQDIIACRKLGADAPVLRAEQARGYSMLSQFHLQRMLPVEFPESSLILKPDMPFPDLPRGIKAEELSQFFEHAWQLRSASWSDVVDLRNRYGPAIRNWIARSLTYDKRPAGNTISQIAEAQARDLHERAKAGTQLLATVVPSCITAAAVSVGLGVGVKAAGVSATAVGAFAHKILRITGGDAALTRAIAGRLGGLPSPLGRGNSFLVNTPFYEAAADMSQAQGKGRRAPSRPRRKRSRSGP